MTVDINELTENLSELLTNSTNLASSFYDVFLNENAIDVTLQQYDADNILQTYTIPNRAKDREIAKTGIGSPEGVVAAGIGTIYVNTADTSTYIKVSGTGTTGWIAVFNDLALSESMLSTDGTLAEDSDELIPSQKAVKTYADTKLAQNGDGSAVTNLNASNISSGVISASFLPTTVTLQGNSFNGNSQLVQLTSDGKLPALDGSNLTNILIPDTIVQLGTVSSGTVTLTADKFHTVTFSGASTIALPTGLTSGVHYNCTLLVTLSSVVTITQPTVTWAYSTTPSMTSTTAKYRISYETVDAGATWYGYWTRLGT